MHLCILFVSQFDAFFVVLTTFRWMQIHTWISKFGLSHWTGNWFEHVKFAKNVVQNHLATSIASNSRLSTTKPEHCSRFRQTLWFSISSFIFVCVRFSIFLAHFRSKQLVCVVRFISFSDQTNIFKRQSGWVGAYQTFSLWISPSFFLFSLFFN